jgi:uncharacterized membrane protein
MLDRGLFILTFAAAIGSGLVAGVFFAFSSFVMAALGRLPSAQGIAAMQSINVTVLNSGFLIALLGAGAVCAALAAGSFFWWDQTSGKLILVASLLYIVGCVGVTMVCNVPLNDMLAAIQPGTPEAANSWSHYLSQWTFWNHLRTLAPVLSGILFTVALINHAKL